MGAISFADEAIASDLRLAREAAKLTQAQLAKQLGKSQVLVSRAESGHVRVGSRYVAAVLEACGLPAHWKGVA